MPISGVSECEIEEISWGNIEKLLHIKILSTLMRLRWSVKKIL
jgi:hypothetical protein